MLTATLTMVDGVRIVAPDSLELLTPYVLREQQDWFEDEIKFLRRLLKPGDKVIDVGANLGVYALSMAKAVGPSGAVWAFEPTSSTAGMLAEGIEANGFEHVVLTRAALSRSIGTAKLYLQHYAEGNTIVSDSASAGTFETVAVTTLDACLDSFGWQGIDFIKIDAEGSETDILEGGGRFFADLSPLVQFEVDSAVELDFGLVQAFAVLGYDSYRLVPGLDLLIPFDPKTEKFEYLLNLFCCKADRAAQLSARGFLLDPVSMATGAEPFRDRSKLTAYSWRSTLAGLPYGAELADLWERTAAAGQSLRVEEALAFYGASQDTSLSPAVRFYALSRSFIRFSFLCEQDPSFLRLASLARVARDYGVRAVAVKALLQLRDTISEQKQLDPSEPFLAPCARFDAVPPGAVPGTWVGAAVLEALERIEFFTSFFIGDSSRQRLETIRELGFGSAEMERRLLLVQQRFGLAGR